MRLSVIIPTEGRRESLAKLLDSLLEQNFPKEFEILLIANEEVSPWLKSLHQNTQKRFPKVKLFATGLRGVNTARNRGIKESLGEILYFLDDDCVLPHRNLLAEISNWHDKNPDHAIMGGRYRLDGNATGWAKAYDKNTWDWMQESEKHLVGGNLSFKHSLFEANDFRFAENIFFGGAETELLERLDVAGFQLKLCPSIVVDHYLEMNFRSFLRKAFLQGYALGRREICGLRTKRRQSIRKVSQDWRSRIYHLAFGWGVDWAFEHRPDLGQAATFLSFGLGKLIQKKFWRSWRHEASAALRKVEEDQLRRNNYQS